MSLDPDLSSAAALLAEPARAAMLARLMDGRSWTATELAKAAGVVPSTASAHLARLLEQGWVAVHPQGRFRYYRLAGEEIAAQLEAFAALCPPARVRTPGEAQASRALRHCRLCYGHLAGRVGVALAETLRGLDWVDGSHALTEAGQAGLAAWGLAVGAREGRPCMDWSERRPHLSGPLGRELAQAMLKAGWLQRDPKGRALWITPAGRDRLAACLGELDPVEATPA